MGDCKIMVLVSFDHFVSVSVCIIQKLYVRSGSYIYTRWCLSPLQNGLDLGS